MAEEIYNNNKKFDHPDLQRRCWSQGRCQRVKLHLHLPTGWLNDLKLLLPPDCSKEKAISATQQKKDASLILQLVTSLIPSVPVRRTLVEVCVCWFVHLHPYGPTAIPSKENESLNGETKEWSRSVHIFVKLYRRGGEVEATPVLPSDEVDRLATQSAGLSAGGGVLGTRSGLPEATPEKPSGSEIISGLYSLSTRSESYRSIYFTFLSLVMSQSSPLSASESVLLKWLW